MMKNFEDYAAGVREVLADSSGRRYSDNYVAAGLRDALEDLNDFLPLKRIYPAEIYRAALNVFYVQWLPEAGQKIYEIDLPGADGLPERRFMNFIADERERMTEIELCGERVRLAAGQKVELVLAEAHTISGLDECAVTTVPERLAHIFTRGAAGYCMQTRAAGILEVFGKKPEDYVNLLELGKQLIGEYKGALNQFARIGSGPALPEKGWGR